MTEKIKEFGVEEEYRYVVDCPTTQTKQFVIKSDRILSKEEVFAIAKKEARRLKIIQQILWEKSSYYPISKLLWHRYE